MGELTKSDVRDAFREVVFSPDFIVHMEATARRVAREETAEKFKNTLAVDCASQEDCESKYLDIVFLSRSRAWAEENMAPLTIAREWAEDDGALKDIAALQKVARAVRSTTSTFAKAVFYLVVASGAALAGIESITHDGIKSIKGIFHP